MSAILYKMVDGKVEEFKVNPLDVAKLLKEGYSNCPEKLENRKKADTNESGKLSSQEVKEVAKKAGIKIGRKSIETLRKELNL